MPVACGLWLLAVATGIRLVCHATKRACDLWQATLAISAGIYHTKHVKKSCFKLHLLLYISVYSSVIRSVLICICIIKTTATSTSHKVTSGGSFSSRVIKRNARMQNSIDIFMSIFMKSTDTVTISNVNRILSG